MKVFICCYEKTWILSKFATRLREHVATQGVKCIVSDHPKATVDVNHHISGMGYDGRRGTINTLMVTHVDHSSKVEKLRVLLRMADMGICMSHQTMRQLESEGMPQNKLCVILPGHDHLAPRLFRIGLTTRTYRDGRKREGMLLELAKRISPDDFRFTIMGRGWDGIVSNMKMLQFKIDYFPDFDLGKYNAIIPELDYYLYLGQDEGSVGFLDACSAGVKTIVTPQGYHLDAIDGITHGYNDLERLVAIFKEIVEERKKRIASVAKWTWEEYARQHIEVWRRCLGG